MKAYLQLTLSQLRVFARNRQVLVWTMLFPVLLMVMLGSFTGDGGVGSVSGAMIDEDRTGASGSIAEAFSSQDAVELDTELTKDKAMERLKDGDIGLVVVIPKGYGDALAKGGSPASIQAYYDETSMVQSQLALAVVGQIVDHVSKAVVQYEPVVVVEQKAVQSVALSYIDFLVPGIVAMMIMSNNLNGVAGQIASWRERGILRRMQSTPLKASTFIAGQITARLILNGIQAVLVLLIANLIFDTQVNGSWLYLLLFVVLGTLAFMAIGFIIAGVARTPESAGPIAGVISFPLMFLGGVFFPISNMPDWFQPIVKALPIAHLSDALRQIMNVGAGMGSLWFDLLLLSCWMIGAFIVASFTFRWD